MSNNYPEEVPKTSPFPDNFTFSLSVGREQRQDIDLRVEAIEARISRLESRVTIDGFPVLGSLLKFFGERPDDLEVLGKALIKVAPLMRDLNSYRRKRDAFLLAEEDPDFFRWGFGDWSTSFDVDTIDQEPEAPRQAPKHPERAANARPANPNVRDL